MRRLRLWLGNLLMALAIGAVWVAMCAHIVEAQRRNAAAVSQEFEPCWDDRHGAQLPPVMGDDC